MPAKTILAGARCPLGHWTAQTGDVSEAYTLE